MRKALKTRVYDEAKIERINEELMLETESEAKIEELAPLLKSCPSLIEIQEQNTNTPSIEVKLLDNEI